MDFSAANQCTRKKESGENVFDTCMDLILVPSEQLVDHQITAQRT